MTKASRGASDWWDIKRSESNAHEVKRCEHVRHTNSNDTANLRIEVPDN